MNILQRKRTLLTLTMNYWPWLGAVGVVVLCVLLGIGIYWLLKKYDFPEI